MDTQALLPQPRRLGRIQESLGCIEAIQGSSKEQLNRMKIDVAFELQLGEESGMRDVVETGQSGCSNQKRGRSVGQEQLGLGLSGISSVGKPRSRLGGGKLSMSCLAYQTFPPPIVNTNLEAGLTQD